MSDYNFIAPYYDFLASLVFGKTQQRATEYFLSSIPPCSRILIAGGGTGKILEDLSHIQSADFQIVYVEKSIRMLELARKRNKGSLHVEFVHNTAEFYTSPVSFDCIITSFLLDNFTGQQVRSLISHLGDQLTTGGVWLNTDFEKPSGPYRVVLTVLMRCMYLFFRIAGRVEAGYLPQIRLLFKEAGYREIASKSFYKGLIRTVMFGKPGR